MTQVENSPAVKKAREMWVQSVGREDPREEEMATHSSILGWRRSMDRGAWRVTVRGGRKDGACTQSQDLRLGIFIPTYSSP